MAPLKHGFAYWIDRFPPLRGGEPKRRPAIYLDLGDALPQLSGGLFVFVGSSTEEPDPQRDYDAIRVMSGLPEPSWIYPEWVVEVPGVEVGEQAGRLPLVLLEPLIEAIIERAWGFEDPPEQAGSSDAGPD